MLLFLWRYISSTAPFPKCLHFHTPDFPRLHSSSTAQGLQLVVDFAWRPVLYNPGILIALTVTWDCLMHLLRTGKEKKKNMWNCSSYRKTAYLFVIPAEYNPRTILWLKQPNSIPQKQNIFGFSEIIDFPKKVSRGNQLKHDGMPLQKRTKDSHFLSSRIEIPLSFHFLKELT